MQQQQQMYILFQDSRVTNEVIIETINRLFALNATVNNNSSTGATTEMFLNLFTTLKRLYFKTSKQLQQNANLTLKQILKTLLCSGVSEQRGVTSQMHLGTR